MRRLVLAMVVILGGCDALAGSDYVGEPLITLSGSFAVPAGAATTGDLPASVALLWQDAAGAGGPGGVVTSLPIQTSPPARFTAAVPVVPPAAARFSLDGIELAEAYVYLIDTSAGPVVARGRDRGHALIYASADVPAGSLAADYLGGPVSAGYHLRAFAPAATPGAAQQQMIARCVTGGAIASACTARRAYALSAAGDRDPLTVDVSP
nr:hypothetical protein [Kofleriaceae bacterium]